MSKLKKIVIIVAISTLLIIGFVEVLRMVSSERRYSYGVRVGSAGDYLMLLDFNHNYLIDKVDRPILPFTAVGGPASGSQWGRGDQATGISTQPLPYGIKVRWFSIAENQFWEGGAIFDQAKLEKLSNYKVNNIIFRTNEPFINTCDFTVNYAPGGLVTVWISGEGEQYLVSQFRAKKVDEDNWKQFSTPILGTWEKDLTRERYLSYQFEPQNKNSYTVITEKVMNEVKEHKVPTAMPWLRLMNTYPWILTVNDEYRLTDYFTKYTNGEQYYTYQNQDQYKLPPRAVPYEFIVYIENNQTKELKRLELTFDKEEMLKKFEALNKSLEYIEPIKLHFNISDNLKNIDVYLMRGKQILEIKEMKAELVGLYNN